MVDLLIGVLGADSAGGVASVPARVVTIGKVMLVKVF
jgi:hypothetical protein